MVNPFQSIFFISLGAPVFDVGLLAALSSVVTALMYLVGGYVADTWGRRRVIIAFSFVAAANAFFYFFIRSWTFLFIPVTVGAISGIYTPAFNATLNDSFEPELRPKGFASFTIVTTVPSVFAPYLGGLLMDRFGYVPGLKIGYFASGLLGVLGVTYRALKLKETHKPERVQVGILGFLKGIINENVIAIRAASTPAKRLVIYSAISSVASGFSTVYVSLYLINGLHVSSSEYGLLTGLSALITIFLLMPAVRLIKRIGLKKTSVLSALSSPVSMLVFVSANGMNDLIAWSVTGGVSGAILSPSIQSLQGNYVPKHIRGRLMAMFNVVPLLVTTPAQVLAGYMYAYISHVAPFLVSFPFYAYSVYILTRLERE